VPKSKFCAAIIGCGHIGTSYSNPQSKSGALTHAHAYAHDPRTELVALLDSKAEIAKKAAKVWGVQAYDDLEEMFNNEKIDIVSICVPDEAHQKVLEKCLLYFPKAVFCEKPMTTSIVAARKLVGQYARAGIILSINFSRRWNPGVIQLKEDIQKGKYGQLLNAQGTYTKGILHNGSHMIDLMRYLCGEITQVRPLSSKADWKVSDPSVDAFLQFSNGASAHLCSGDERHFSIFELEMIFTKARVSLKNFGEDFFYEKVVSDPVYKGYKILKLAEHKKLDSNKNILYAIAKLVDVLEGKNALLSSGGEAYKTQLICHQILNGAMKWKN